MIILFEVEFVIIEVEVDGLLGIFWCWDCVLGFCWKREDWGWDCLWGFEGLVVVVFEFDLVFDLVLFFLLELFLFELLLLLFLFELVNWIFGKEVFFDWFFFDSEKLLKLIVKMFFFVEYVVFVFVVEVVCVEFFKVGVRLGGLVFFS